MRPFAFALTLVGALAVASVAAAHPHGGKRDFDPEQAKERFEKHREKRTEILEKVQEVRRERIKEAFDLNEKDQQALFEVLEAFDQKRFEAEDAKHLAMMDLRQAMSAEEPDPRAVEDALDRLEGAERTLIDAREAKLAELKRLLEPVDRARFLVAEHRFEREVHQTIRENYHRRMRRRRMREGFRDWGPGPGGPEEPGPEPGEDL